MLQSKQNTEQVEKRQSFFVGVTWTPLFSRGVVSGEIKDQYLIILVSLALQVLYFYIVHCLHNVFNATFTDNHSVSLLLLQKVEFY